MLLPGFTIFLPATLLENNSHLLKSLSGMTVFYAFMIFMIYDHYKSDYFLLMIVSFVINLVFVSTFILTEKQSVPFPETSLRTTPRTAS